MYVFDGRQDFELFLTNAIEKFARLKTRYHTRSHAYHQAEASETALTGVLAVVKNSNLEAHYNES